MVQLRLKMKVIGKVFKVNGHQLKLFHESPQVEEEFVADSLVLPILCDDVPWMALKEFLSFFFYMLSFWLHFITCSHWGQYAFQVWGGFRKNLFSIFLFSLFYVCCIGFVVVIFVSIFCLFFCIYIYMLFCFCCFFLFFVCCICFVLLFYYFTVFTYRKLKNNKDFCSSCFLMFFVEFRHSSCFFIRFLSCINCKRCTIFSWEVSCLVWTIVAIVEVVSRLGEKFEADHVW